MEGRLEAAIARDMLPQTGEPGRVPGVLGANEECAGARRHVQRDCLAARFWFYSLSI